MKHGGKQYRVTPGETVQLETLAGDVGAEVEFNRVLAVVDGERRESRRGARRRAWSRAPSPSMTADAKTIVFKFKRKKQYKRTIGHRQNYTRVQINEIA